MFGFENCFKSNPSNKLLGLYLLNNPQNMLGFKWAFLEQFLAEALRGRLCELVSKWISDRHLWLLTKFKKQRNKFLTQIELLNKDNIKKVTEKITMYFLQFSLATSFMMVFKRFSFHFGSFWTLAIHNFFFRNSFLDVTF